MNVVLVCGPHLKLRLSQKNLEILSVELTVEVVGMDKIFEKEGVCVCVCIDTQRETVEERGRKQGRRGGRQE